MKKLVLLFACLISILTAFAQQSDFIVLKKNNNRTLKTYFPGAFISAYTNRGFFINGTVTDIRHDSIFWRQEETRLIGTEFGSAVDTIFMGFGVHYTDIVKYNYTSKYRWGGKKGFVNIAIPKILILGGLGFVVLESVNTIYRKESFNDSKKLTSMGIAAGAAAAGFLWTYFEGRRDKVGRKYKVIYLKREDIKI